MRLSDAINIEDLHRMAKRRLPKIAFDFIEGGLEDERGLERNTSAFHKHRLLPRYLVDVSKRDQTQTIFGQTFSSPFGISPTGGAGLFRRGADLMLAEAAADANIPYIMSGSSNDSIESAARVAPNNAWYQLYAARDAADHRGPDPPRRRCGLKALVLTVDVPVHSKRERNIRNGFANIRGNWMRAALSLKPALARRGDDASRLGRRIHQARRHADAGKLAALCRRRRHRRGRRSSSTARRCRRTRRPGRTSKNTAGCSRAPWSSRASWIPADAVRAADIGCDGVIVSNHGGRQLDQAPASLDVLPAIKAAVGDRMTVMLDSGVRRGADILIAMCLGAQFVLLRPADALRRGRRRTARGQEGGRHLPHRDRHS